MGRIHLMDGKLANMIAAGEVVERPSSVIKELVENSIDASSSHISVHLYDAGRTKIIVEDDGVGMDKDDALLAFKRHATSKLFNQYDLFRIKTLGFRGEALPSIASVSKMHVLTSTGEGVGSDLRIIDEQIQRTDAPLRKGTRIEVEELFYNTPARLKYLKSDYTENANSIEIMCRLALGHPEISFKFYIDDKEQFKTTGRGDLLETIASIYGYDVARNMVPFTYENNDFKISGFLGKPEITKSTRYFMITLLNGRNVYMPKVQSAIIDGYHDFIPVTRYPFVILNLTVDYSLVDVNVHPSKKEVRFSKEEDMRLALIENIPEHLSRKVTYDHANVIPKQVKQDIKEEKYEKVSLFDDFEATKSASIPKFEENEDKESGATFKEIDTHKDEVEDEVVLFKFNDSKKETKNSCPLRALAQLKKTYIIAESEDENDGFYLVDQHAAMERINFEHFQKLYNEKITTMSPLLPKVINLNPSDYALFNEEKREILKQFGLSFEPFGYNAYKVIEVPTWITKGDEGEYVDELINMVIRGDRVDINRIRRDTIASMACKASLKANHNLSVNEMQTLLNRLYQCENPHNCPHGRPIIIKFSNYELAKLFKRTGV